MGLRYCGIFKIFMYLINFVGSAGPSLRGLHCGAWLSLIVLSEGHSLVAVPGLLIAVASLVVERGLSSCMARGLACPWGSWNLPGPGTKPVPSALAAGFLTTGPPDKSRLWGIWILVWGADGAGF